MPKGIASDARPNAVPLRNERLSTDLDEGLLRFFFDIYISVHSLMLSKGFNGIVSDVLYLESSGLIGGGRGFKGLNPG